MYMFPEYEPSLQNATAVAKFLPRQTIILFNTLIPLLQSISMNSRFNKMTTSNLAKTIAPSLVRVDLPSEETAEIATHQSTSDLIAVADPIEIMNILQYNTILFESFIQLWPTMAIRPEDSVFDRNSLGSYPVVDKGNGSIDNQRNHSSTMLSKGKGSNTLQSQGCQPPPLPSRQNSASATLSQGLFTSPSSGLESAESPSESLESSPVMFPSSASSISSISLANYRFSEKIFSESDNALKISIDESRSILLNSDNSLFSKSVIPPPISPRKVLNLVNGNSIPTSPSSAKVFVREQSLYVPRQSVSSMSVAAQTPRSFTMPVISRTKKPSVVGGFRCVSDSQPRYVYEGIPSNAAAMVTNGPPNLPPKPIVTMRKRGKIVEELSRIYEERSQSADLLVHMGNMRRIEQD